MSPRLGLLVSSGALAGVTAIAITRRGKHRDATGTPPPRMTVCGRTKAKANTMVPYVC